MAKTWLNYACTFYTSNTENNLGDSRYVVTSNSVVRHAPINRARSPDQVNSTHGAICYLVPGSNLYKEIMGEIDDRKITVAMVDGDRIHISLQRGPIEPLVCECTRKPANGLVTFDFDNTNGVLSHIHVGHKVHSLKMD